MIVSCQMDRSSLRQLSMVMVTSSPVAGASVAAGASVLAGASVAAGSVAAGSSVAGGAWVAGAPPPHAVRTMDRATSRLIRLNNLRIFLLLSNWSCNRADAEQESLPGKYHLLSCQTSHKIALARLSCSVSFQIAHTRPDRQRRSPASRRVKEQYPAGCGSRAWSAAAVLVAQPGE